MADPPNHSAITIRSETTHAWGGIFTHANWNAAALASVTMSNTSIFNSDSRFLLSPANGAAGLMEVLASGIWADCTSNGTVTLHTANAVAVTGGNVAFSFITFRGGVSQAVA